jgi:hypothetical protein
MGRKCNSGQQEVSGLRQNCLITTATNNFIQLSPFWAASTCTATQKLPRILWNTNTHFRSHKGYSLVHILCQFNLVRTTKSYFSTILILPIHLRLRHPCGLYPTGFRISNLRAFISSPVRGTWGTRGTCPANFILLNLITIITLGNEYMLWRC